MAHGVLLCEMEWGLLQWENGDRFDRIGVMLKNMCQINKIGGEMKKL